MEKEYKAFEWEQEFSPKYTQVYITKCVSLNVFLYSFSSHVDVIYRLQN